MVLSDDSVKFPVDSSKLSPEAQQRLSDFADKLKTDNRNVYLEIQGHTDAKGPDAVNSRLGEERAEAVRLFMNQHGVPLNRMATISYGKAGSGGQQQDPARPGAKPPRRAGRDGLITGIGAAPGPPGRLPMPVVIRQRSVRAVTPRRSDQRQSPAPMAKRVLPSASDISTRPCIC